MAVAWQLHVPTNPYSPHLASRISAMDTDLSRSGYARLAGSDTDLTSAIRASRLVRRDDVTEQAILWLFVIALAWVPLYYGSNDLTAWGINAVLFPGLAAVYEVSLLIRRKSHPI